VYVGERVSIEKYSEEERAMSIKNQIAFIYENQTRFRLYMATLKKLSHNSFSNFGPITLAR